MKVNIKNKMKRNVFLYINMVMLCLYIFTSCAKDGLKTVKYKGPRYEKIRKGEIFVEDIRASKWFDNIFDDVYINENKKLCIIITEDKNKTITYKPIDKPRKKTTHETSLDTLFYIKRKIIFNEEGYMCEIKKKGKHKWKYKSTSEQNIRILKSHGKFYFNKEGKLTSFTRNFKCLNCPEGAHIR